MTDTLWRKRFLAQEYNSSAPTRIWTRNLVDVFQFSLNPAWGFHTVTTPYLMPYISSQPQRIVLCFPSFAFNHPLPFTRGMLFKKALWPRIRDEIAPKRHRGTSPTFLSPTGQMSGAVWESFKHETVWPQHRPKTTASSPPCPQMLDYVSQLTKGKKTFP